MYFSHLLQSDFPLTTGKHTQMTKENTKGMKDFSASNVRKVTFQGSPYMYTHYSSIRRSRCRSHVPKQLQCL